MRIRAASKSMIFGKFNNKGWRQGNIGVVIGDANQKHLNSYTDKLSQDISWIKENDMNSWSP